MNNAITDFNSFIENRIYNNFSFLKNNDNYKKELQEFNAKYTKLISLFHVDSELLEDLFIFRDTLSSYEVSLAYRIRFNWWYQA